MAEQANVSSIDALEAFRADLIQFIEKARVALEDAEGGVRRMRSWLDDDRSGYWTGQWKQRTKQLEQAEAELYSVNLTSPGRATRSRRWRCSRRGVGWRRRRKNCG